MASSCRAAANARRWARDGWQAQAKIVSLPRCGAIGDRPPLVGGQILTGRRRRAMQMRRLAVDALPVASQMIDWAGQGRRGARWSARC